MRELAYVLAYVVWFSTLIPLVILWTKKRYLNDAYKALAIVLIGIFSAETFSFATNQSVGFNLFSTHFTMVLITVPPLWFFHTVVKSPEFSRFLRYAALVYLLLHGIDLFYTASIYEYNWLSRAYTSVLFTYCGIYYLLRLRHAPSAFDMDAQPLFWFCLAIAMAAAGVFLLDIAQALFDPTDQATWPYLLIIHLTRLCLLILSRILYTVGAAKVPRSPTL